MLSRSTSDDIIHNKNGSNLPAEGCVSFNSLLNLELYPSWLLLVRSSDLPNTGRYATRYPEISDVLDEILFEYSCFFIFKCKFHLNVF